MKIDNKPVMMVYSASCFNGDYVSAFAQLPDSLGCDVFLVGDVNLWKLPESQDTLISIFNAVTKYHMYEALDPSNVGYPNNTAFFQNVEEIYNVYQDSLPDSINFVPNVMPGYTDRAAPHHILPQKMSAASPTGTVLTKFFKMAKPYTDTTIGNMIMITSWNEWLEDTQIEPNSGAPSCNTPLNYTTDGGFHYTYENYGESLLDRIYCAVNWLMEEIDI